MTEVSICMYFITQVHTPLEGMAYVSGAPCRLPEPSADVSCSCGRPQPLSLIFLWQLATSVGHLYYSPQQSSAKNAQWFFTQRPRCSFPPFWKSHLWSWLSKARTVVCYSTLSNEPLNWCFHLSCLSLHAPHSFFQGPLPKEITYPHVFVSTSERTHLRLDHDFNVLILPMGLQNLGPLS